MSWGCVDTCCLEQHRARSPEGSLKYANAPKSSDTSDSVLVDKEWCHRFDIQRGEKNPLLSSVGEVPLWQLGCALAALC